MCYLVFQMQIKAIFFEESYVYKYAFQFAFERKIIALWLLYILHT